MISYSSAYLFVPVIQSTSEERIFLDLFVLQAMPQALWRRDNVLCIMPLRRKNAGQAGICVRLAFQRFERQESEKISQGAERPPYRSFIAKQRPSVVPWLFLCCKRVTELYSKQGPDYRPPPHVKYPQLWLMRKAFCIEMSTCGALLKTSCQQEHQSCLHLELFKYVRAQPLIQPLIIRKDCLNFQKRGRKSSWGQYDRSRDRATTYTFMAS